MENNLDSDLPALTIDTDNYHTRFIEATTKNSEYQKKLVDGLHSYTNEEAALGWVEGSWDIVEKSFQEEEKYSSVSTEMLAAKIKNNFPGKYEMRSVICSEILGVDGTSKPVFVRRHNVDMGEGSTVITEIIDIPKDVNSKETRIIAKVARNNDKIVNLMDVVDNEFKNNVLLKFKSKLPPMPAIASGILCVLAPSLKEGSVVEAKGNKKMVVDEAINKRIKGVDNELPFLHEAGHTNQLVMRDMISSLKSVASKIRGSLMPKISRYWEKDAFMFAIMVSNKFEELGVPILPKTMRGKDFWTINGNELQMTGEYKSNNSFLGKYKNLWDIR